MKSAYVAGSSFTSLGSVFSTDRGRERCFRASRVLESLYGFQISPKLPWADEYEAADVSIVGVA